MLRMIKTALILLFVMWKYARILVYENQMAAECRLPSFVIIIFGGLYVTLASLGTKM